MSSKILSLTVVYFWSIFSLFLFNVYFILKSFPSLPSTLLDDSYDVIPWSDLEDWKAGKWQHRAPPRFQSCWIWDWLLIEVFPNQLPSSGIDSAKCRTLKSLWLIDLRHQTFSQFMTTRWHQLDLISIIPIISYISTGIYVR